MWMTCNWIEPSLNRESLYCIWLDNVCIADAFSLGTNDPKAPRHLGRTGQMQIYYHGFTSASSCYQQPVQRFHGSGIHAFMPEISFPIICSRVTMGHPLCCQWRVIMDLEMLCGITFLWQPLQPLYQAVLVLLAVVDLTLSLRLRGMKKVVAQFQWKVIKELALTYLWSHRHQF